MNASRDSIGSDLTKVDAYENTAKDYDEIPELDEAFFARAVVHRNGVPVTAASTGRASLTLNVDSEIIARFRAAGSDWEERMEDVLRKAVGL